MVCCRLEVRHRLRLRLGILGKEKLITGKQLHDAVARLALQFKRSLAVGMYKPSSFVVLCLGLPVLVSQACNLQPQLSPLARHVRMRKSAWTGSET